jgi:hypothetical protein
MQIEKITFKDFEISYDGVYNLIVEKKAFLIYLSPVMLLTLFEREGYTSADIKKFDDYFFKIPFKKTSISLFSCLDEGKHDGYLTSSVAEGYQDKDLYILEVEID